MKKNVLTISAIARKIRSFISLEGIELLKAPVNQTTSAKKIATKIDLINMDWKTGNSEPTDFKHAIV